MPIFEYICEDCGRQTEILMRNTAEKPVCSCGSSNLKKKLSTFAVSEGSSAASPCADGSCALPSSSCCSSGTCGLH
jgi:putative FmdB family regulatory protein